MNRKSNQSSTGHSPTVELSTLARVKHLIQQKKYALAIDQLHPAGHDVVLKNAKGVCLLRLGHYAAAVNLYRELVFKPGCVWVRPDVPTVYKVNFATALLLAGNLEGGTSILGQAMDENHPGVKRLRACIGQWKRRFSFWQRLVWMCGYGDEAQAVVPLDFELGLFEDGVIEEFVTVPAPGHRPAA
ncbi:tetratricopeptide repeat protein [Bremerella sp.]|uniref:tetratricopeptide repeat protein n=1 Tax=Bremerella sp. TaxID=2795602 RepID=UPI00391D90A0